jgi:hypothetical protein
MRAFVRDAFRKTLVLTPIQRCTHTHVRAPHNNNNTQQTCTSGVASERERLDSVDGVLVLHHVPHWRTHVSTCLSHNSDTLSHRHRMRV